MAGRSGASPSRSGSSSPGGAGRTAQLTDEPIDLTEPRAGAARTGGAAGSRSRPNHRACPPVDESALRYFARTGDQRRLDAEMARLKALYPDWMPPANPAAPEVFVDPQLEQFWQLFSEGSMPRFAPRSPSAAPGSPIGSRPPR